jgi:hypothetical protein
MLLEFATYITVVGLPTPSDVVGGEVERWVSVLTLRPRPETPPRTGLGDTSFPAHFRSLAPKTAVLTAT